VAYSFNFTARKSEIAQAAKAAFEQGVPSATGYGYASIPQDQLDNGKDAIEKALDIAIELVQSGVIGGDEDTFFSVNVSGHANPDHKPTVGYANDAVTISINQQG
jgi:hypothetical protein